MKPQRTCYTERGWHTKGSRFRKYRSLRASPFHGFYLRTRDGLSPKYLRKQRIKLLFFDFHAAMMP